MKTYTRDGRRAGAAVSGSMQAVRKRAGKQAERTREQLAKQLPDRTAEIARSARDARRTAQDALAERLHDARHEFAARIEPESRRSRRWPWIVLLLLGIAGAAGAAVLTRRSQQAEFERLPAHPPQEVTASYNDQDATGTSATGNGVVRAGRSSSSGD